MPSIRLPDQHGFSVNFSTFWPQMIACCTSQQYGLKGTGSMFILEANSNQELELKQSLHWVDGLFDLSWSKRNEDLIVTASGDGSLQLWKIFQADCSEPLMVNQEHTMEVSSVDWTWDLIASGSWDFSIKVWHPGKIESLLTLRGHTDIIHSVKWSPTSPNMLATVAKDSTLRLWDKDSPHCCSQTVCSDQTELLDCDWSTRGSHSIVTCGSNGVIYLWDTRRLQTPYSILSGHMKAVRKVKWSPHHPNILASVSFDLTTIIWDVNTPSPMETIRHHSGFVHGLDFNSHTVGEMADCGWDSLIHVYVPTVLSPFYSRLLGKNKL